MGKKKPDPTILDEIDEAGPDDDAQREQAIEVAAETLTGDMRDFILDRLKHEGSKRPWHERSEGDQRDVVHQVEVACEEMVRKCVEIIAAQGLRTIKATLDKITIKDGIKGEVSCSKFDEARHLLCDAQGKTVLIVVADPAEFTGEREPVQIRPDQATLLGDGVMAVHSETDGAAPFH